MELFELLEAYAPAWYTEDQRERAVAALDHIDTPALHVVKPARSSDSSPTSEPATVETRFGEADTGGYLH